MTAMNPATAARIGSRANPDTAHGQDSACRRLWASVLLHVLNDCWHQTARAKGSAARIASIHAEALRYFRTSDGRQVVALAGLTADPERMADMAVDLTARARTIVSQAGGEK